MSWDIGAGADVFNHIRVSASYSIGISKAMEQVKCESNEDFAVIGKDRFWTVSAAYMF